MTGERVMTILRLAIAQLRMYVRDRQSLFFALFFPLFFMLALGLALDGDVDPIEISVVHSSPSTQDGELVRALLQHELLSVTEEGVEAARRALDEGQRGLVLVLPEAPVGNAAEPRTLNVLVNAAEPQRTQQALAVLNDALIGIEHEIRGTAPLFTLDVEDVDARSARYVDFLIPGLLAFMVLQLSIAGSGFNIVEYKRKGILTRLFVTPLRPSEFIAALIASRLIIVLVQITLLLVVAELAFDISIQGNVALLYALVIAGSVLFLSIGFALGGVANTQPAVMALGNLVIFPQIFLAGVFFPPDVLPEWLQPVAAALPLAFVSSALRRIANEGAAVAELGGDVLGLAVWIVIGVFLAIRLFSWSDSAKATPRA